MPRPCPAAAPPPARRASDSSFHSSRAAGSFPVLLEALRAFVAPSCPGSVGFIESLVSKEPMPSGARLQRVRQLTHGMHWSPNLVPPELLTVFVTRRPSLAPQVSVFACHLSTATPGTLAPLSGRRCGCVSCMRLEDTSASLSLSVKWGPTWSLPAQKRGDSPTRFSPFCYSLPRQEFPGFLSLANSPLRTILSYEIENHKTG